MPSQPEPRGMSKAQSERTKEREGFKAEPYADGKTGHSIGYGFHKSAWPDKAVDVQTPITREKADELFQYVDNWNANYMAKKFGADNWNSLDQRQVDALLSVAYNAGAPGLWKKVGRDLKEGNFERAAETLETYATTGYQRDKKVDLCPRRKEDADLFRAGSRQIQMGVGGSVGVEVSYSSDKGWSWWPAIGFGFEVALTGPAAVIVGGITIGYAAYCIMTKDNDAGDACSEEESKEEEEEEEEDESKKEEEGGGGRE